MTLAEVILNAMHDHSGLMFEYAAELRDQPPPEVQESIAAAVTAHLLAPENEERVAAAIYATDPASNGLGKGDCAWHELPQGCSFQRRALTAARAAIRAALGAPP